MAWDGGGTFNRVHNFSADASAGIQAQAVRFDAEFDGIKTGLENCQTLTGETSPTANAPMGGFKHTGVAAATSTDNYLRADQNSNQVGIYVRDTNTGVTGVMSAVTVPFPTSFTDGQRVTVKVSADGSAAAVRAIRINGLSADILDNSGSALPAAYMFKDGVYDIVYDASAGGFKLLNSITPAATVKITDAASKFTSGNVEGALQELAPQITRVKSVIKGATTWRTSAAPTSALLTDPELVLSLSVGATYEITAHIVVQNAAGTSAGGIKYRFGQDGASPNGQYEAEMMRVGPAASTSVGDLANKEAWNWGATPNSGTPASAGQAVLKVSGIWPVSSSATDAVNFWWAPLVSAAASVGVARWSYLKAEKI